MRGSSRNRLDTAGIYTWWKHLLFWTLVILLLAAGLSMVEQILLPFIIGVMVAYFLDPVVDRLEARGMDRGWASFCIISLFFAITALAIFLLAPMIYRQSANLASALIDYAASLKTQYEPVLENALQKLEMDSLTRAQSFAATGGQKLMQYVTGVMSNLWQSGLAAVNLLSLIFIMPVVAFYLLRDWDRTIERLNTLLPRDHAGTIRGLATDMNAALAGFIRGQTNVCLLLGAFYAIGLTLAGLNYGLVIGLGTGIASFIPIVGMSVGVLIGMATAYMQFGGDAVMLGVIAGIFAVGSIIEGNFLSPRIVGDKVNLHPLWIIFALLAGSAVMGFMGILIAVPAAAVIAVLVRFALRIYKESDFYGGEHVLLVEGKNKQITDEE